MKLNKQAFTLTELLMVVLMIGILSSMVLPKFTKMVDSFRVMEAEQMLHSVRSEQEKRCTLGRQYTADVSKLSVLPTKKSGTQYTTANYEYNLTGSGMTAKSPKNYILEMPSYLDGRICCDACANVLNKSYLTCAQLQKSEDFQKIESTDACKS